ncbi:hypothetical protein J6590_089692 [Homalodisca vitripennis]|nr:hypothetical protein J6590_089692 [Homalodisca vitripennis]
MVDSHIHGLVKFVEKSVRSGTIIRGVLCKSEGGLLDIRPTCSPPLDFCYVFIAGTNDVDDGREDVVFSHLESVLTSSKEKYKAVNYYHHRVRRQPQQPPSQHRLLAITTLLTDSTYKQVGSDSYPTHCVETGQHKTAASSTFPCADVRPPASAAIAVIQLLQYSSSIP